LDLSGREDAHEAHEVTVIEAVVEQTRDRAARGIQIALDVPAHLAAAVVHAVVGIGALDRIAQLRDQPGARQQTMQPLRRPRVGKVTGRLLADELVMARAREVRPVPRLPFLVTSAEIVQLLTWQIHLIVRAQIVR
jgi:hypothetical protein